MFPLLPRVGHGADLSRFPSEDRPTVRRGAPQALRITPVTPGWPPMQIVPQAPPATSGWGWLSAIWPTRRPDAQPIR